MLATSVYLICSLELCQWCHEYDIPWDGEWHMVHSGVQHHLPPNCEVPTYPSWYIYDWDPVIPGLPIILEHFYINLYVHLDSWFWVSCLSLLCSFVTFLHWFCSFFVLVLSSSPSLVWCMAHTPSLCQTKKFLSSFSSISSLGSRRPDSPCVRVWLPSYQLVRD